MDDVNWIKELLSKNYPCLYALNLNNENRKINGHAHTRAHTHIYLTIGQLIGKKLSRWRKKILN